MRCAIDHNGRRFTVLVTELLPGPRGTVATCRELPDLLEIGDDPDDALRRAVKTIERAVVPAGLSRQVTGRVPPKSRQPDAAPFPTNNKLSPGRLWLSVWNGGRRPGRAMSRNSTDP